MDMDKAARESLRWLILHALYSAQPIGASEQVLFQAIVPSQPLLTTLELQPRLFARARAGRYHGQERAVVLVRQAHAPRHRLG